jgi:hypothetical protein
LPDNLVGHDIHGSDNGTSCGALLTLIAGIYANLACLENFFHKGIVSLSRRFIQIHYLPHDADIFIKSLIA